MALPKILIIDDDAENLLTVKEYLGERYQVDATTDPLEGLRKAGQGPALILLDVDMPRMNGFELFGHLQERLKKQGTPVVFLTAQTGVASIQKGLKLGAADYLLKPFRAEELLERVQLRLKQASHALPLKCGNLVADPATNSVRFRGEKIFERRHLSKRAFLLLQILIRNEGNLLTRDTLLSEVWPDAEVSDRVVDLQICRLRKKLAKWDRKIVSVYEEGYFVGPAS